MGFLLIFFISLLRFGLNMLSLLTEKQLKQRQFILRSQTGDLCVYEPDLLYEHAPAYVEERWEDFQSMRKRTKVHCCALCLHTANEHVPAWWRVWSSLLRREFMQSSPWQRPELCGIQKFVQSLFYHFGVAVVTPLQRLVDFVEFLMT